MDSNSKDKNLLAKSAKTQTILQLWYGEVLNPYEWRKHGLALVGILWSPSTPIKCRGENENFNRPSLFNSTPYTPLASLLINFLKRPEKPNNWIRFNQPSRLNASLKVCQFQGSYNWDIKGTFIYDNTHIFLLPPSA